VVYEVIVPPKRDGRNVQPPVQPAVRWGEGAVEGTSNFAQRSGAAERKALEARDRGIDLSPKDGDGYAASRWPYFGPRREGPRV
jgi:hypothetical protein